jgi:L,D-transpeptidase ErfK/SrfK
LFALGPIGTKVHLINEPVKLAWVDGQLYMEAHPPVDAEGQTIEPDLKLLSDKLDKVLGSDNAAIHWDLARSTLQAASGIPTMVGIAAEPDLPSGTTARATASLPQASRR